MAKIKATTEVKLGDVAKDKITGLSGVVVGITHWLNGCTRATVQPQELKDGKPIEAQWFDVQQLERSKSSDHVPDKTTGGPRPEPKRR